MNMRRIEDAPCYQADLDPNPVRALGVPRIHSSLLDPDDSKGIPTERDPLGLAANAPGAKLDAGKVRPSLVLGGFARALLAVSRIGTDGAAKYTEDGWMEVPNGVARYDDAKMRHWLYEKSGIECDPDTNCLHAAHECWNSLARLDLLIREKEKRAQGL